jgi:hypothetical protein
MRSRFHANATVWATIVVAASLVGCAPESDSSSSQSPSSGAATGQEDADGHDHPETFTEAVSALRSHHDAIRDGFQSGSPEEAHDPLHEVGHVMEGMPKLAADAGMAASDLESLKSCLEQLFEAYGTVDDAMHTGQEPDYEAVAQQLEDNVSAIEQLGNNLTATDPQ